MERKYPEVYTNTIGMDFTSKLVSLDGSLSVKLQLWDSAGKSNKSKILIEK